MARPSRFPHLPDHRAAPDFLYVLEANDGAIKVGRTQYPRRRMTEHDNALRHSGRRVVRSYAHGAMARGTRAEDELLTRMRRIASMRFPHLEVFGGISYGAALTLLRQVATRAFIDYIPLRSP